MHEQLTAEETSCLDQLHLAIRSRDRLSCDSILKHLEHSLGVEDLANLLTELMAELAPTDFEGSLWLLASSDQTGSEASLQELLGCELAAFVEPTTTAPDPEILILARMGSHALALDPSSGSEVLLVHLPTSRRLGSFPDELSALDAMLALEQCPG